VHLVFTHPGRLSRLDIRALRAAATIASGGQLLARERFARDPAAGRLRLRILPERRAAPRSRPAPMPIRLSLWATRYCAACLTLTTQLTLPGNRRFCQSCRSVLGPKLSLGRTQEAEWQR
jgi:hypothetical protein